MPAFEHTGPKDDTGNNLAKFLQQAGGGGPWRKLILKEDAEYQVERGLVGRGLSFCEVEQNGAKIFVKGTGEKEVSHHDDFQMWPRKRSIVRIDDGWGGWWHSSRAGAWIFGGYKVRSYSLGWAVGLVYETPYEAQHGFCFDHCRDFVLDIGDPDNPDVNNIEISYVRGDLIAHTNYSVGCEVKGSIGGDAKWRAFNDASRGPGIHHSARQGLQVESGCWGARFHHLPVWQVGRSWADLEPGGGGTVYDVEITDMLMGSYQNTFLASGGDGHVNKVLVERIRGSKAKAFEVFCWDDPSPWRGEPKRRSDWKLNDLDSEALYGSPIPMMQFGLVDRVSVTNVKQKISDRQAGRAFYFEGCTDEIQEPNQIQLVH